MKCPNCKKEIENGSTFCEHCGTRVKKSKKGLWITWSVIVVALIATIVVTTIQKQQEQIAREQYRALQEQSELDRQKLAIARPKHTCLKEIEGISGTVIEVEGVEHGLGSCRPSLYGSIAAQSEACSKICEHVVGKIENVADRCGEEIDAELEKSILEHTEKELLHIVRPELVCVEYGDDHVPDSRGMTTSDIRFYCSATMHQPVAPIAQWLVSIGNSQQRQKLLKIVNEIFEINKNGESRKSDKE